MTSAPTTTQHDHPLGSRSRVPAQRSLMAWIAVEEPLALYAGGMLAGITLYFALPLSPSLPWVLLAVVLAIGCWLWTRTKPFYRLGAMVLFAVAGFAAAHIETLRMDTALLWGTRMPWGTFSGEVSRVDYRTDSVRVILDDIRVEDARGLGWMQGEGVQLRLPNGPKADTIGVGQKIRGRMQLFPIGPSPVPGSFDLQFRAYFQGVSAYASPRGDFEILDLPSSRNLNARIQAMRRGVKERMQSVLGEEGASVLVAMTVGFARGIPTERLEALRAAGLAHLLAISGLHMSLIVGGVFVLMRLFLVVLEARLFPTLWRVPAKKFAILIALFIGLGYFFLSGQAIPVQRAFLMSAVFATAILLDRRGISLRTLAVAAIAVMAIAPHVVMGPSFQMSFAAVGVLIAVGNSLPRTRHVGPVGAVFAYLGGVAMTSAIATAATATLTLYHFGDVSMVSVLANVVAVPVAAFVVMPAALIAILLMPLGLDGPFLHVSAFGLEAIQAVANWSSSLPNSTYQVASWPRAVPGLFAGALVLGIAMAGRAKALAILPLIALVVAIGVLKPADVIIGANGGLATFASHDTGGTKRLVTTPQVDDFERSFLGEYWGTSGTVSAESSDTQDGVPADAGFAIFSALQSRGDVRCSAQGCDIGSGPSAIALALTREAVNQACQSQKTIVSTIFVAKDCRNDDSVGDFELERYGPYALWLRDNGALHLQSDLDRRGRRPWTGRGN